MTRAQLGDSPDTSKALRSLVMAGLVLREGRGGRSDTFRYKVTSRAAPQTLNGPECSNRGPHNSCENNLPRDRFCQQISCCNRLVRSDGVDVVVMCRHLD